MIKTILIANRGEIACRIIRTAKKMGIKTVTVYSEADADAMHVKLSDTTVCIGASVAKESYLNVKKIIDAAILTGAEAIHPGYGFLSENASFVESVEKAGLIFIGAPSSAIASMGSKSKSKQIMTQAGVPLIPGCDVPCDDASLIKIASAMRFPVLLKASAGGGGKGMRIVSHPDELSQALSSAKREAQNSFGDSHMIVESYIEQSRHVEVQVFFDKHGNGVYLFDRDCSLQRRYQKIIEEAPAPGLSPEIHQALGETALKAASAVNYAGAGTVEFLVDDKHNFYFMEMNTRLQVEHPITEMITGVDLVEWQIRVACGEPLPVRQEELAVHGHAVEARLYAEEPAKNFAPATGCINYLAWPDESTHLRIDTGIAFGDTISPWYDPMIAKVITWGENRDSAFSLLSQSLQHTDICGLPTNRDFLIRLLSEPDVLFANPDTAFIDRNITSLTKINEQALRLALIATTYFRHNRHKHILQNWRINKGYSARSIWSSSTGESEKSIFDVALNYLSDGWNIHVNNYLVEINSIKLTSENDYACVDIETINDDHQFKIFENNSGVTVICKQYVFALDFPGYKLSEQDAESLTAPMNGIITSVNINGGTQVHKDQVLLTLEAMKMEISIKAPEAGTIDKVNFTTGDSVSEGDILASYAEDIR